MEAIRIDTVATAFIRPDEGANVGLIHTSEGLVLIDTTSSPADIKALMDAVGASAEEVRLVINTHFHNDHTWGNQVFNCPILAHRLCQDRMHACLESEWSPAELQSYLADLEKRDPTRAAEFTATLQQLHIKVPDKVFELQSTGELGRVNYEVIHLGGHTPDLSVVWLPQHKLLFASDLIFQGRYPYIFDADVPVWINRLDRLLEFGAEAIVPGHGTMSGEVEIRAMQAYLRDTWELTAEHLRQGHTLDETLEDNSYLIFAEKQYERLHRANIGYIYKQISPKNS